MKFMNTASVFYSNVLRYVKDTGRNRSQSGRQGGASSEALPALLQKAFRMESATVHTQTPGTQSSGIVPSFQVRSDQGDSNEPEKAQRRGTLHLPIMQNKHTKHRAHPKTTWTSMDGPCPSPLRCNRLQDGEKSGPCRMPSPEN